MKFKKKIQVRPAFDKRNVDESKNYGIHGCDIIFTLIGEKGAVTFVLFTGWHLPHIVAEMEHTYDQLFKPMPTDIGYHSPYAMYEDQKPREQVCEYIGVPCYVGGSALYSDEYFDVLVKEGTKGLWKKMIKYYKSCFGA